MRAGRTLFCVLLLAGCAESEAQTHKGPPPAPLVVTGTVETGPLVTSWTYVGQARALDDATLAAGAAGEVLSVAVREGDSVAMGDLLVDIDDDLVKAQVRAQRAASRETRTTLAQAKRDRARAEHLGATILAAAEIEQEVARAQELDARAKSARARLAQAQEALQEHEVRAPFAGVVAERLVDVGDWVDAGAPVLRVVADQFVEVLVDAAPELSAHVEVGTKVSIFGKTGDADEASVPATVVGVVRALDPKTRTIKVRVLPERSAPWLMPGSPVHVRFPVTLGDGLVIHRDALVQGAVATRVVRLVKNVAEAIEVEVVASTDTHALVKAPDLQLGDTLVVRGNERLRPGQNVRVE